MLTASNLSMSFGGRILFEDVSLSISRGDKIALVGPNGAGKSTLFSLLLGEEEADEGSFSLERGATLGWLPQETAAVREGTVLELACSIGALGGGGAQSGDSYDGKIADWDGPDHSLEPKAKRILSGLAFRNSDFDRPVGEMSGGWIMRAHLARLLVMEPDLLLLDEPTNHLDLETLGWFLQHLKNYRGAILLISHDRAFLNDLVDGVLELRNRKLHRYRGNFDDYLAERDARAEQHLAAYKNQQKEIADLQRFADRFRAKASKASQAQSKLRQIERMEKIEAPEGGEKTMSLRFPQPERSGQIPLRLEEVSFSYGDLRVYDGIGFECERGDRIALVGPNGAGKSTLLKLLAGVLSPSSGSRVLGLRARIGYFSQNRVEMLSENRTVIEEALALEHPAPEQLTRSILGAFLFRGDDIFKKIEVLSGGEKSRLALAKLLLDPPNVLLMDEPTTHLDMASIDSLAEALQQFEGTLVFISHDVFFIRALARKVLRVEAGNLRFFAGGYDYYLDKIGAVSARDALVAGSGLVDARPEESRSESAGGSGVSIFKTREQKREEARKRQEAAAKRKEIEGRLRKLERESEELERRHAELAAALEDPGAYAPGGSAMEWNREMCGIAESLEKISSEWERHAGKLENIG